MGLILKHIERTSTGSFQYRRRVPKDVSGIIAKREFKRKLGVSEKEALAAWPQHHAAVEREIEAARRRLLLMEGASSGTVSEREAYAEVRGPFLGNPPYGHATQTGLSPPPKAAMETKG